MAITQMQKVALYISKTEVRSVLHEMQKYGIFEAVQVNEEEKAKIPDELQDIESKIADLDFLIRFLSPVAEVPKNFREKVLGNKVEGEEQEAVKMSQKDFSYTIEACTKLEEQYNQIHAGIKKNSELIDALTAWESLSFPLGFDFTTETTTVFMGSVETKEYNDFEREVIGFKYVHLQEISRSTKNVYFFLIAKNDVSHQIQEVLGEYRYAETHFEGITGHATQEIESLRKQNRDLKKQLESIESKKKEYAKDLREIKLAYDGLLWKKSKKEIFEKSLETQSTVLVHGWVPAKQFDDLKKAVAAVTLEAELSAIDAAEGETPPVLPSHNTWVRPFQKVTDLFGVPSYSETDPTPYLAPFFFIFFGFCLTDAGYGVLITVSIFLALKFFPLTKDFREMLRLLLFGGVSTIIMGVLFGGYFGLEPKDVPFFMNPETGMFYGQILNPVEDLITKVAPFAYGLAVTQLLLGVILKAKNEWAEKNISNIVFLQVPEVILVVSMLVIGLAFMLSPESIIISIFTYIALGMVALMVWGLGSRDMGIAGRIITGIPQFFMDVAVAWLANILSYSRLFSLGLATGVIALAFNSIATTLGGMMNPFIGVPIMIFLILFGHTLNVGLNLLGAFVHSGRLQFVEFFGKFLEGSGRAFRPLKREKVYLFDAQKEL